MAVMYQADTAILLAAGLGSRMLPITENIPKPLVKINGKPLIDTIVQRLLELDIKNIYIITGYLKEQFLPYAQKYQNITLLTNEEYETKNNISSIHVVKDILINNNCIICEADLYLKDPQIIQKQYERSKYMAVYVDGESDDWSFRLKNGRMTEITIGGNNVFNMVGISFWTRQDGAFIAQAVMEAYELPNHKDMYWDEIVNGQLKNMNVGIQEVTKDQIVEIDTVKEYEMLNEQEKLKASRVDKGISPKLLYDNIAKLGIRNIAGVPDSTLAPFCDYLIGKDMEHLTTQNEGGAAAYGAGVYLATNRPVCVYMQNSGIGNIFNPMVSLLHEQIYQIPMLFLVGYRGAPGEKDEPQHVYQGEITIDSLNLMGIENAVIDGTIDENDLSDLFFRAKRTLSQMKPYAIVIKKDTFTSTKKNVMKNNNSICREAAIKKLMEYVNDDDIIISTTGKISREVYEVKESLYGNHDQCFLCVGAMGHASMIALGMASELKSKKVFCFDGDGAALMHMGSFAVIGNRKPQNMIHIILNNHVHESVGGMPTAAPKTNFSKIAENCGYDNVYLVSDIVELKNIMEKLKQITGLVLLEIRIGIESRDNLGRPKETPLNNKINFMKHINKEMKDKNE